MKTPTITVHRRIRPIRFAFAVDPREHGQLLSAFQASTVLWGGRYNAIVPVFGRAPKHWGWSSSAAEIVRGILDVFEPDLVVAPKGLDTAKFGVAPPQTLELEAMLTLQGLRECGLGVMPLYQRIHDEELRFVRKDPLRLVLPRFVNRRWSLFAAACFGSYPEGPLDFFAQGFRDLGGVVADVTDVTYFGAPGRGMTPLAMGSWGLEERGVSGPSRTFFVLDPTSTMDLIDLWNLRALGWRIRPIPIQSALRLTGDVLKVLNSEHAPHPIISRRATILKSRSVSSSAFTEFGKALSPPGDRVAFQNWMPRLEKAEARVLERMERIEVSAGSDEVEARVEGDRLTFRTLAPEFVPDEFLDRPRFANVVTLRSYDASDIAALVPKDIVDLDRLTANWGRPGMLRTSSEGLTLLANGDGMVSWRVLKGIHVFEEWLKSRGEIHLSGAGRIARRLIEMVGGPDRERLVNGIEVVKLFGQASQSASSDLTHEELLRVLLRVHQNNKAIAERRISALLRQGVLRFGMRLQCESCSQHNWYALEELRESLPCRHCLDQYPFPMAMPPRPTPWSYRPLGPFGVRGFAYGSYVVAASLRLLANLDGRPRMTWVPSIECRVGGNATWEADFAALWHSEHPPDRGIQTVFGECKTFDEFSDKDVRKMRRLGRAFPGATLVFSTFRDQLKPGERAQLASLATWGRKRWRAPVMVLTATELTSDFGPPYCWRNAGGSHTKMADAFMHLPGASLRRIADATQQLYLGLAADADWPHRDSP